VAHWDVDTLVPYARLSPLRSEAHTRGISLTLRIKLMQRDYYDYCTKVRDALRGDTLVSASSHTPITELLAKWIDMASAHVLLGPQFRAVKRLQNNVHHFVEERATPRAIVEWLASKLEIRRAKDMDAEAKRDLEKMPRVKANEARAAETVKGTVCHGKVKSCRAIRAADCTHYCLERSCNRVVCRRHREGYGSRFDRRGDNNRYDRNDRDDSYGGGPRRGGILKRPRFD